MLRRGVLGVCAAEEWLLNLEHACRRRLPDITDTAPGLARTGAEFHLLPVVPSPKVARAFPRLIAEVSPVIEWRSPRIITAWISQLLDPAMQRELRRRTPTAQLKAVTSPPRRRIGTARALRDAMERAEQEIAKISAHRDEIRADLVTERARIEELKAVNDVVRRRAKVRLQRLRKVKAEQTKLREVIEESKGKLDEATFERRQVDQLLNQARNERNLAAKRVKVALRERDSSREAEAAALDKCERLESELVRLRGQLDERVREREENDLASSEVEGLRAELAALKEEDAGLIRVRPPGKCKLPWFLVVLEHRSTLDVVRESRFLVSPSSRGYLRMRRNTMGSWILELTGTLEEEPSSSEDYGLGSLPTMMRKAEVVVAEGFPTAEEFDERHRNDRRR